MYNRDKFLYDVAVGITFRTDKEIPVIHEVLRNYFQSRNKQKHYSLKIWGNPYILMKCSLTICIIILFQQFSCKSTWFDILLKTHCSQKQPPEVFATLLKWDSNTGVFLWNLLSFYDHLFWTTSALLCSMVSWCCSL